MHEVHIAQSGSEQVFRIRCAGKGCPLCSSTAEERARITFVKATKR